MNSHDDPEPDLSAALAKMTGALRILDKAGAPGDIGSHLDLAIARLEERLGLACRQPESAEVVVIRLAVDASEKSNIGCASAWDIASA